MVLQNVRRPSDRHLSQEELDALVLFTLGGDSRLPGDAIREAEHHLMGCEDCSRKMSVRRLLSDPQLQIGTSAPGGDTCPKDEDVDWHEVAAGLWPELKTKQLLVHAALCDHCGPLLRAALCVDDDPTPEEESFLAQLKRPSRPESVPVRAPGTRRRWQWQFARWAIPVAALIVMVGMLLSRPRHSTQALSGPEFVTLAAETYQQQAEGMLALDVHAESQQQLNEWLKAKSPFAAALPSPSMPPAPAGPFRIKGARLLSIVNHNTAAYIAYEMQTGPVGLMVIPDSLALASGGVVADFKKVSFHYSMEHGLKVVTWSIHGLTYGLVSREGNQTQQSCMVCHSAMRDRDLTYTPTPLDLGKVIQPLLQ